MTSGYKIKMKCSTIMLVISVTIYTIQLPPNGYNKLSKGRILKKNFFQVISKKGKKNKNKKGKCMCTVCVLVA